MKKFKKAKKGFTLVELIVVIAILAILAIVLVPRISGYQEKARKSTYQQSAKTILDAVEAYNADKTDSDKINGDNTVAQALSKINSEVSTPVIKESGDIYEKLKNTKVSELDDMAAGKFKVKSDGTIEWDKTKSEDEKSGS